MKKKGLFKIIRETSFTKILILWLLSILFFGIIYWLFLLNTNNQILLNEEKITFNIEGFFSSIYVSLLNSTFLTSGIKIIGIIKIFFVIQTIITILIVLILIDKIIMKYIYPEYYLSHYYDKKINTLMLMMSIFRNDADRLMHEYSTKKKHIQIKDIESLIDGFYVALVDMEKIFSEKNIHKHKIKKIQYLMLTENIEDTLHKLQILLSFLEKNKINWRDKSTEFWIKYILKTTQNIANNIEKSKINPNILIATGKIKEYVEQIEEKIINDK
ncbi:MAG: hypothetical protein QXK76_00195 [Candidatus Woesearchaeota archaeon]